MGVLDAAEAAAAARTIGRAARDDLMDDSLDQRAAALAARTGLVDAEALEKACLGDMSVARLLTEADACGSTQLAPSVSTRAGAAASATPASPDAPRPAEPKLACFACFAAAPPGKSPS